MSALDIDALRDSYFAGRLSWGDLVVMTGMASYELHPLIYGAPALASVQEKADEASEAQP